MRLSQIDGSNRADHHHLREEDLCLFLYEYSSGRDYSFSTTNNLISNLKKKPSQRQARGYEHKARVIDEIACALRGALNPAWLSAATLVPVPSSKAADHPDHDDRIERICRTIGAGVDTRPLVVQTASSIASHEAAPGERLTVEALRSLYRIDEELAAPAPRAIGIVDDILTAGTHFRAMEMTLSARFPAVPIVGLFVARRVFASSVDALSQAR